MTVEPPPGGAPPDPLGAGGGPTPAGGRRLGEIAALVSAGTAVAGLLLGFFGLPTVVNSPTAQTVTQTVTATATVTATVTATPTSSSVPSTVPTPSGSGQTAAPAPKRVSLVDDLQPVNHKSESYTRGPQKVNGTVYPTVLSSTCASATWQLDREYTTLTMSYGLADSSSSGTTVKMYIELDGERKVERAVSVGSTMPVNLDVSGVFRITLGSEYCFAFGLNNVGAWIDPVVTKAP
ncbi:NPCBM/NEW2 domain-containing protein [Kitasatospora sp. NPDC050463]|uniref:NPCBM/NEW2 domain-containing protein n=1 Tax=Kitasatospora sp. NPDC050463 TaxID=3155786 RepID=UPI0033DF3FC0